MKILIEIAQQTNVHFFKNIIKKLSQRGHSVYIVARDRELTLELLREYDIPHQSVSRAARGQLGLLGELALRAIRICGIIRHFQPDVLFTRSYSLILAGKLTRRTVIFDTDDGKTVGWLNYQIMRLADIICTPEALGDQFGRKQILYSGYKELAYLHPDNFHPAPEIPIKAGVAAGERYFLLRFSAYNSFHDLLKKGFSKKYKMKIIDALKPHGRVFITSEQGDKELDHYRVGIPQGQIHSLLYYSSLYAGDSQTMAGEAAVLGVPSVRCSSWVGKLPTLEELEKRYGLTYGFSIDQQEQALNKIRELVNQPDAKRLWQARRERMLRDKIDLADYYMRLIESKSAKLPSLG